MNNEKYGQFVAKVKVHPRVGYDIYFKMESNYKESHFTAVGHLDDPIVKRKTIVGLINAIKMED